MADTIGDCGCGCGEVRFTFASIAASVFRSPLCQHRFADFYNATKRYKTLTMRRTIVWPGYSGVATIVWDWDHRSGVLKVTSSTGTAAVQATMNELFDLLGETVGTIVQQQVDPFGTSNTFFFFTSNYGHHIATDLIWVSGDDAISGLSGYLPAINDALFDATFGTNGPAELAESNALTCWDDTAGSWITQTTSSFALGDSNANIWGFWAQRTYTGLMNYAYLDELYYGIYGEADAFTKAGGILTLGKTKVWGMPVTDVYCRLEASIAGYVEIPMDPFVSSYCGGNDTSYLTVTQAACASGVAPVAPSFIFEPPAGVSVYARAWNANIALLTEGGNFLTRPFWYMDFTCCTGSGLTADSTTTTADSTTTTADSE